jgi:hypothetical protein
MKGLIRRTTAAILLLLAVAFAARVIFALLVPLLPLLIYGLGLVLVLAAALGFLRRL